MNWTIIIIETIIMTIAFTAMILIPLVKNPVWWIHDYPKDIQEEYFKTHERVPSEFFSKTVLVKKGFALTVELEGVEPSSKQGNHTLSTRLFQPSVFVRQQDLDHQLTP